MTTNNPYHSPNAQLDQLDDQETYSPRFFSVDGRLGRVRYLAYSIGVSLPGYLLIGVSAAIAAASQNLGMVLLGVSVLLMLAGTLIIVGRRLHDLDLNRWFALLMLVPYLNGLFGLYLLFAPGTKGRNRFGPMPEQNGRSVIVVACILPAVFIIGILAAIAIPQYAEYTKKAKAAQQQGQSAAPVQIPEASE
ncbi:hypothetical protein GCM10007907_23320 [Chitinimonas prasina]|uniref:DUF805 domain-containing protein n=1 Tax=Chitinimonas prasina TaxID=1434937 RepID=A0ABQ5YIQ1_9NEIS|nr:DUF805 domain-containing protein [Chitinimonas prasina]GLR13542.1 hypothetical protein GCM10007907_23320 [Chitinimonas prasina]